MTKMVDIRNLKPGDVIRGHQGKQLIFLFEESNRRTTLWGAYNGDARRMIEGDPKFRTRFYGVRPTYSTVEVYGKVKGDVVKKLEAIYKEMKEGNRKHRDENFKRLDFKHDEKVYGYVLKLDNGEEIKAGDTVVVSFKNGPCHCRVGNKKGHLYDTKTGRVYIWPFRRYTFEPDPYRKHAMTTEPKFILRKAEERLTK